MQIHIEEVPLGIRRRAAQLLENVRNTDMDPTDGRAILSGEVIPIYRPDMKGIAYYEFAVDLGRNTKRQVAISGKGDGEKGRSMPAQQGFIIAASDGHDHPVAHWSLNREPPSRQIEMAAEEKGAKVARLFKLDSLSYAGETQDGELAGQTGQLPLPIEGLPDNLEKAAGRISSTLARPAQPSKDDSDPGKEPHEVVRRGARPQRVKIGSVKSWKELREGYEKAFSPLLRALAQKAAPSWEVENLVAEMGEGIMTGTTHKVALLEADAMAEIVGEGADLVKIEPLETKGKGGALALHVTDKTLAQEMSFELHISYRSGTRETLQFFAVSPSTPSGRKPEGGMSIFEE